jgi:dienelactone hydrolase
MPGDVIVAANKDGRSVEGYLAVPDAGNGPGVLLIVENGADDLGIRQLSDLYAAEG